MNFLFGSRSKGEPAPLPPREKFKALHDLALEALTAAWKEDSEGRMDRALRLYRTGLEAIQEALALPGVQGSGGRLAMHGRVIGAHGACWHGGRSWLFQWLGIQPCVGLDPREDVPQVRIWIWI